KPADIKRVVRPAAVCTDLLDRAPAGWKLPRMKVRGGLLKDGGPVDLSDVRTYRLRCLCGRPSYILFHSPGCSTCDAELEAVRSVFDAAPGARVLLVNPAENGVELLDAFDLSVLPFALEADRRGTVVRKYISFL
nr:peroxiredoxin family protein [Bacteroidales bacterium]